MSSNQVDAIAAVVHSLQTLVTTDACLEAFRDVKEITWFPDAPISPPPPHTHFANYPQPVVEVGGRGGLHLGAAAVVPSIQAAPISHVRR